MLAPRQSPAGPVMAADLVTATRLRKDYLPRGGLLRGPGAPVRALDDVSLSIARAEVLGVVGESGCGKTTLGRTLLYLQRPTSGTVTFDGVTLGSLSPEDLRRRRRRMQIVFQDPFSSLNPRMPVYDIVGEGLLAQGIRGATERARLTEAALESVGLRAAHARRYPHEFSGGQRQRIGIARALVLDPDFVVLDEAVSALDVSIQSQILNLLSDLQRERRLSYLFIAHDLSVVRYISHRVAVMYLGRIVEMSEVEDLYQRPLHPYTVALMSAVPEIETEKRGRRIVLQGDVPSPVNRPAGCHFHPRCWLRRQLGNPEICVTTAPPLAAVGGEHQSACHFSDRLADRSTGFPP
jgi:oligopeptide transport system ATP-binding protein